MDWKYLLADITGTVDQELLLRNAYLVTDNRILRAQLTGRPWPGQPVLRQRAEPLHGMLRPIASSRPVAPMVQPC